MSSITPERAPSTAADADDEAAPTTDDRRWFALAFIVTANVTVFGGVTIMNVALPAAQDDLGLSNSARQWVVTIFALTFGSLILLGGRLGDTFGLRRTMVGGLVGYAAASAAGAIAPVSGALLAARAGQGATAAIVAATALALLSRSFPGGADREKAFGVLGTVMGLGGAGAFVVGGALTELSWRWCLAVSVPIALVAAVGVDRTATGDAPAVRRRLDLRGAVLITSAIALLIFGFDRGATTGWTTASTLGSLVAGIVLLVAFVAAEASASVPLLPLSIVADRGRAPVYVAVFLLGLSLFAGFFLMTFYLQDVLGYSPLKTGFGFLPFGVAAMAASKLIGPAMRRWSAPTLLLAGLGMTAAGAAYLTRAETASGYIVAVVPAFLLYGLGATTVMVTASNRATIGAGEHVGVASAGVGASQQIGGALGTALLGSIATSASTAYERSHGLADGDVEATVHGLTTATAVSAVIVVVGAVVALLLGRPAGRHRGGAERPLAMPAREAVAPCAGD